MRIAIVGSGVAGLVAAHRLAPGHDVVVYEADDRPGGHSHTVTVDAEDGTHEIDTGFIVFNDRNYPRFRRLLTSLAVAWQPSSMSFGVSNGHDFEFANDSVNGVFACRRHAVSRTFHRIVTDMVRWQRESRRLVERGGDNGMTVDEWLADRGFSRPFVERMIVPLASAIWSAAPAQMSTFPAVHMARFFEHHGLLDLWRRPRWSTVVGGSRRYVEAITSGLGSRLRLGSPVAEVHRTPDHVEITAQGCGTERFDHVVVATHADQALTLLADPTTAEREVLGAIPFQPNEAVLHTDRRLLPRRRSAWASWNFHLTDRTDVVTVTYHMNRLQQLRAAEQYCVTLNRTEAIDPARVLRTIGYHHPVFTTEAVRAQARHAEISGIARTHYCGAYWGWGFHEDGVASADRVVEAITRVARG